MKSRSDIAAGDIVRMNYHAYRVAMVEGDPRYGEQFTLFAHQLSGERKAGGSSPPFPPTR